MHPGFLVARRNTTDHAVAVSASSRPTTVRAVTVRLHETPGCQWGSEQRNLGQLSQSGAVLGDEAAADEQSYESESDTDTQVQARLARRGFGRQSQRARRRGFTRCGNIVRFYDGDKSGPVGEWLAWVTKLAEKLRPGKSLLE